VNLYDTDGAVRLVGELVKLDRLPNETSYQGLLLLRSAWCEFDGAMMNANKYKLRSKLIFFMHLVISVAIIIIGNLLLLFPSTQLQHALYGLATVITVLSGLDSLLNPNKRWHQLRSMACSMEATICVPGACRPLPAGELSLTFSYSNSPCILKRSNSA